MLNDLQVNRARTAGAAPERPLMRISRVSNLTDPLVSSTVVRILKKNHMRVPAISQSVEAVSTAHVLMSDTNFNSLLLAAHTGYSRYQGLHLRFVLQMAIHGNKRDGDEHVEPACRKCEQ